MNNEPNNNQNNGATNMGQNNLNNPNVVESLDVGSPSTNPSVNPNLGVASPTGTFFNNAPVDNNQNLNSNVNNNVNENVNNGVSLNNNVNEQMPQPTPATQDPTPAFTNPQTIGAGPVPGFTDPNSIGTTPPISLEKEKKPKKKGNKIIFIILILVLLAGVGFGTYYVLNYTDLITKHTVQTNIVTKDIEIMVGEELSSNISDYAEITGTASSNCQVNKGNIDTNKAGVYEFVVICGDTKKTGKINVINNPEVEVNIKKVFKSKNATLEAKEFAQDENDGLNYEFVDSDSVQNILEGEPGTYTIKLKVSNETTSKEVDAELVILEYEIKGYLTCTSKAETIADVNAEMVVSERFGIANADGNLFAGLAYEIHTFKFNDETQYADYLAKYNTDKSLTLNNVSGIPVFDNENKTITYTRERDREDVVNEYKEENVATYGALKSYFKSPEYSCTYNPIKSSD